MAPAALWGAAGVDILAEHISHCVRFRFRLDTFDSLGCKLIWFVNELYPAEG
jgi:hypothetical protein